MQARIDQNGDVTVVHLFGQLNYEAIAPFRQTCMEKLCQRKIIFNLQHLSFVGSIGITPFVDAVRDFAAANPEGIKLCRVGSEFRKVFTADQIIGLEIFEDQRHAEASYYTFVQPIAQDFTDLDDDDVVVDRGES